MKVYPIICLLLCNYMVSAGNNVYRNTSNQFRPYNNSDGSINSYKNKFRSQSNQPNGIRRFNGANGQYIGSVITNGNVQRYYNSDGSYAGSAQFNGNRTTYYGANGSYQGSSY